MRAALITGSGRRIGAAVARDLAANGWHVVVHYHRSGEDAARLVTGIEAGSGVASALAADLADERALSQLVDRAFELAPGLEMLVNNASTFAHDTFADATPAVLHRNFNINTVAPVMLARHFAERLPRDRTGVVINILDNRVFAPNPDHFAYGVSKSATFGATRAMALALAPRIRVNGIAPGITLPSGGQTTAEFEAAHAVNPLGRGCSPEEIAAAVRLIAGSPAMTGAVITIDGGLALANPGRDVAFVNPETQ